MLSQSNDNVCSGKDGAFYYATKTKVEFNQNFSRYLLSYKQGRTQSWSSGRALPIKSPKVNSQGVAINGGAGKMS